MKYNIEHTDSSAIRAIAETVGGDVISDINPVTDTGCGIAVVKFPDTEASYIEQLLDECVSVITYR